MIGVFCSLDLVIFYLFFEAGLIPMFLIIGIWGGARRVYSAFKFFLYTLLGSVLMLIAIISIYWISGTTDITQLYELGIDTKYQNLLWLAFLALLLLKLQCGLYTLGCQMRTLKLQRLALFCLQLYYLKWLVMVLLDFL